MTAEERPEAAPTAKPVAWATKGPGEWIGLVFLTRQTAEDNMAFLRDNGMRDLRVVPLYEHPEPVR